MKANPHEQTMLKTILELSQKYSVWDVFSDFITLSALCVANGCDRVAPAWDEREQQYLETIRRYNSDEKKLFVELFTNLILALDYEVSVRGAPRDVLGELFHELGLHNQYKGQFFTPQDICDFMSEIVLDGEEPKLKEKGYITMSEPCCGSGAMVLGMAGAMAKHHLNYSTQLFAVAADIDIQCVYMCYLQLSLYGIPAVVVHGDTITSKEYSHWYTPIYIFHNWAYKTRDIRQ